MVYSEEFEAEPRGWWFEEIAPKYDVAVSVSEVASPCRTGRDVYLRRVVGLSVRDNMAFTVGRLVHEAFTLPFKFRGNYIEVRERLISFLQGLGLDDKAINIYEHVLVEGYVRYRIALEESIPVIVEPKIPGDAVGLTTVRPDLLAGYIPVEIVVANNGGSWLWRKKLALAGYALAIESWFRSPVNYGVVVGVKIRESNVSFDWRLIKIDSRLRRIFLERRDMIASLIASEDDPGVAEECPRSCPFWGICHGKARGS